MVHIPGGLPAGSAPDLEGAKAEFREAWEAFKAKHGPEVLAKAYATMNVRGGSPKDTTQRGGLRRAHRS